MNKLLSKLGPFKWSIHNIIAHPLSEIVNLIGLTKLSNWIHNATLPELVEDESDDFKKNTPTNE